ncbi:MAG TPA: hypothetical protein VJ917_07010 [Saprospiraceae bacterium]|nr:hypothetical protein [Saprospiraceae bacterium]
MTEIKFGTDGWRAIIAKDYTVANLRRIAKATALWMKQNDQSRAVIGYDCRFGGLMFTQEAARVLASEGITCLMGDDIATTPMVSLGVVHKNAHLGVVITASHNPPSYNGYKLKSIHGGPMVPAQISEVEALIPDETSEPARSFEDYQKEGLIQMLSLEDLYVDHIHKNFDFEAIQQSDINLVYDSMYGAGQQVMKRLFPNALHLHSDRNPGFHGRAPEPIHRNLSELSELLAENADYNFGLANDGDADRIGLYDENGHFVDSHHILLLLLYYLYEYKKETGDVVITFSVTEKMKKLAKIYGLDVEVTKIGFKYIAEIMTERKVLVGGEESGGLAVAGHIPERDGIWVGLIIMEFMAKTGKSLKDLIAEVYQKVGAFSFDRDDLHIAEAKKWKIIEHCKTNPFSKIGDYRVLKVEDTDGYKFLLDNDAWVMIRPSGTEPVLRVYAQASSAEEVRKVLDSAHKTINAAV